jgi:hypothetical protein
VLDKQNQGPPCTACGSAMKLSAIEPGTAGHDLRTFTCPDCRRVEVHIIDSAITEAWKSAVQAPPKAAHTHDVAGGRMIPRPAKQA